MQILSDVVRTQGERDPLTVGGGALDAPSIHAELFQTRLTKIGRIVEKHLLSSEKIKGVKIDSYIIMPDHIHAIIIIDTDIDSQRQIGSSRAPTPTDVVVRCSQNVSPANEMLPRVISTFKRFCNKDTGEQIFQRSYADHIIRDREDYETRRRYIYENPMRCYYKYLNE